VVWTSPSLKIDHHTALLIPGRHTLTARDPATGREITTWVMVRRL
jgi:hypothetical protein